MFRIGDFSQLGRVSVRTLHHYDDLGLLKPARVDRENDYRLYALEQLPRLHRIVALKELGFSLAEIGAFLAGGADGGRGLLEGKRREVAERLEAERLRLERLEARLRALDVGAPPDYEVTLKSLPARTVFSKRCFVPHLSQMDTFCTRFYGELYSVLSAQRLEPVEPEFTLFHLDGFTLENLDVEVAVVLSRAALDRLVLPDDPAFAVRTLPGAKTAACLVHHGYFHDLDRAADALVLWAGLNGYAGAGPAREVHLSGPVVRTGKADPVVVEVQVPVARLGLDPDAT